MRFLLECEVGDGGNGFRTGKLTICDVSGSVEVTPAVAGGVARFGCEFGDVEVRCFPRSPLPPKRPVGRPRKDAIDDPIRR